MNTVITPACQCVTLFAEDVLLSAVSSTSVEFNDVGTAHILSALRSVCVMGQVWNVRFKTRGQSQSGCLCAGHEYSHLAWLSVRDFSINNISCANSANCVNKKHTTSHACLRSCVGQKRTCACAQVKPGRWRHTHTHTHTHSPLAHRRHSQIPPG